MSYFKKLDDSKVPNKMNISEKKNVSVNFSRAVFSLLGSLILKDGINRLSWNIGKELSLHIA